MLLVLIHGFPHAGAFWTPVVDRLRARPDLAGWRVEAPDLRGFGAAPPEPPLTLDRHADDLAALIERAGERQAVVCGLSMGGYVAFALWRRHPERVRALVLADTRAGADDEAQRAKRVALAETARREGAAAVAESQLPGALGRTARAGEPALAEGLRALMASASVDGIVGALEAMRTRPDSTPLLPAITVPTLVVVGAEDVLTPPRDSRAMADAIPGATLVEIPAAGHVSAWERPDAFADALADFLRGL
ncbi:alpha/beta fold hydrolase [Roseisolibacter sp. H3M3-2]|uniref:alpha/beta fold hydrolase n=1 Tax=Roseisolibacter sp. H3M3-2 TaxID=3031323 RepID=UPI0023DA48F8|nr:alpha/beta fold hydrolase [Roseisolibacter sp. H3M3-2]MDF1502840.1 alpha/beta fold hydrolase [Roseisolibacter sp. H3M3-2]